MNSHQSIAFSKTTFKLFSSLVPPFYSSLFWSASTNHGRASRRHSRILKTEEEFLLYAYPFFQRFMVLALCHPLIIVFDCENSFQTSDAFQELLPFSIIRRPSFLNITHSHPSALSPNLTGGSFKYTL